MEPNAPRLPIKVVIPQEQDLSSPPKRGGPRKVFGAVDAACRQKFLEQLSVVKTSFARELHPQGLPVVARIVLKEEALAKSHRPRKLFSEDTCPIIGGETFGNLLVSIRPEGLAQLEQVVSSTNSQTVTADLSTVLCIEPFTADNAAGILGVDGLIKHIAETTPSKLKLRLFQHRNSALDGKLQTAFLTLANSLGLPAPEPLAFAKESRLFRIREATADKIGRLAEFVGTQSIRPFAKFRVEAQYIPHGKVTTTVFSSPNTEHSYPIVGLIDSGTDPMNQTLQSWVIRRDERDVPRADQNHDHGSFVAGLITNARAFNHGDTRFPGVQAKLIDVVAMPKDGSPVYEDDLLQCIQRAVTNNPEAKVWNLSISRVSDVCQDDSFSDFGVALDRIQKDHDVTFVICAGNFVKPPFRGWPAENLGEEDRVHPPADSVHAITVGSVAHRDHASTRVRKDQPSPFSRRGPGAGHLPKPEVCHYGGNCNEKGDYRQVGVLSLDGQGNIAEAIGTSFSTPLVATILANIRAGITEPISRNLAKALLVQSAALGSSELTAEELPYRGFGVPGDITEILTCAPWQATLIFEPELLPARKVFAKADFPIPTCFRRPDKRIDGEFVMTLVYDPPCDVTAGAEYCQVNVDVSLGTYDPRSDGQPEHHKQIPLEPTDIASLYEKNLVEHGFKWSPVKVFRRRLTRTDGTRWRLQMQLMYRSEMAIARPQKAALVVTMFDPDRSRPVYDDVVRAMGSSGWITQDLRVEERIRLRTRG